MGAYKINAGRYCVRATAVNIGAVQRPFGAISACSGARIVFGRHDDYFGVVHVHAGVLADRRRSFRTYYPRERVGAPRKFFGCSPNALKRTIST